MPAGTRRTLQILTLFVSSNVFDCLAARIHPEKFGGYDAGAEMDLFYGTLYRLDHTAVEAKVKPAIKMDLR